MAVDRDLKNFERKRWEGGVVRHKDPKTKVQLPPEAIKSLPHKPGPNHLLMNGGYPSPFQHHVDELMQENEYSSCIKPSPRNRRSFKLHHSIQRRPLSFLTPLLPS